MLLTISGPSGSGKSLLLENLQRAMPTLRRLPSYTTRTPRSSGVESEYVHVTELEFSRMVQSGVFLWHVQPHGSAWYGTSAKDVDVAIESADTWVAILTPDILPILRIHATLRGAAESVRYVYLYIDDEQEIRRRLTQRGDSADEVARRLNFAEFNEYMRIPKVSVRILNARDRPEDVLEDALYIITSPLIV